MKKLISKAETKAIRVLKKEILKRTDGCISVSEIRLEDLKDTILEYDLNTREIDLDAILDQALLELSAEEKAKQILTMTARTLIEDVLKGEHVRFEVTQQKNGRLCCKILRAASWLPNKIFRTSFETFREDFIKAYAEFKRQNTTRYYL